MAHRRARARAAARRSPTPGRRRAPGPPPPPPTPPPPAGRGAGAPGRRRRPPPPPARAARRRRARRAPARRARGRRTRPPPARRRAAPRRRPAGAAAAARRARSPPRRRGGSAPRASWQPRLAPFVEHDQAISLEAREGPLPAFGGQRRRLLPRDERREQPPAGLAVGGLEALAARACRRRERVGPGAALLQWALAAAWPARAADRRAELHHRLVPRGGSPLGQQLGRAPGGRARRPAAAAAALDRAACVGAARAPLRAPRERGDGRRGVGSDARERLQV